MMEIENISTFILPQTESSWPGFLFSSPSQNQFSLNSSPLSMIYPRISISPRWIGASDWVNCMLNYGYSLQRAIHSAGLDPHIRFLHEMQPGKYSLAYDLQEPFRFLVDLAVIWLIETDTMEKKDFVRTESFTLRLRPSGAQKVTREVNAWSDKTVEYQGKDIVWDYVVFPTTSELAHFTGWEKECNRFFRTPLSARQN